MDKDTERRFTNLIRAIPLHRHPPTMALRPGFPLVRPDGSDAGYTRPGDRLASVCPIAMHSDRMAAPVSPIQEWVQGELWDADGPALALVAVPSAAIDPHLP